MCFFIALFKAMNPPTGWELCTGEPRRIAKDIVCSIDIRYLIYIHTYENLIILYTAESAVFNLKKWR